MAVLRERYPNLHLLIHAGRAEIRGTFPVLASNGQVLDRYRVVIELPNDFPKDLPIVREVGGRLPWHKKFHIEQDGTACVLMPDDRWRCFPIGAPFRQYLEVPLHNFFLSQAIHAETGEWPFGQWGHGNEGILEYYRWLLDADDEQMIRRFLHILAKSDLKKHYDCPCGSGKAVKRCCQDKIIELRNKIPSRTAWRTITRLGVRMPPYARSRVR